MRRKTIVRTALAAAALWLAAAGAAIAQAPADLLVRPHSPVLGAGSAPVTIVEVFDPLCEACRAWYPEVKKIAARHPGKVRVVMRYALFHKGSEVAAALQVMAHMQGRYEPALDALMRRHPEWAKHGAPDFEAASRILHEVGVDVSGQKAREALPTVQQFLQQDTKDVNALLVERTPTFFVNGKPLENATPEKLGKAVAAALAKK